MATAAHNLALRVGAGKGEDSGGMGVAREAPQNSRPPARAGGPRGGSSRERANKYLQNVGGATGRFGAFEVRLISFFWVHKSDL